MPNNTYESANLYLGIVTGIIGLFGVPANLCVLYLTLSTKTLREKPHCWLIFNLALADLVFCLNNCLLESNQVVEQVRNEIICGIAGFVEYVAGFTSFLVVPAIALNRFVVLNRNGLLFSKQLFSDHSSITYISIFAWFYSITTFLPFVITSNVGQEELGLCGIIANDWLHIYWAVAIALPILFSYISVLICYVCIAKQFRAHKNDLKYHRLRSRVYRESADLVRMMVMICLLPLFAQLPAVFLKTLLPYLPNLNIWWSRILVSPFPLTSACNPYIVLAVAKPYSRAFRGTCCNCCSEISWSSLTYETAEKDVDLKLVGQYGGDVETKDGQNRTSF